MLSTKKLLYKILGNLEVGTVTVNILSPISLPNWGWIRAFRIGRLCVISFHGLRTTSNITSETYVMSLPFEAAADATTALSVTGLGTANYVCNVRIGANTSSILVNSTNANTTYFGQLIVLIKE